MRLKNKKIDGQGGFLNYTTMTARDDQLNVHTNREMKCIEESSSGADLDWLADALTIRI